jgi:diacylglycerol kinase family enzyme
MTVDELRNEIGLGLHHAGESYHGFLPIKILKTRTREYDEGTFTETMEELGSIVEIAFDEKEDCLVFAVGDGIPSEIKNRESY